MNRVLGILLLIMSSHVFAIRNGDDASNAYLAKISIGTNTCTGVRVHRDFFLTAAHCFKRSRKTKFKLNYLDGNIRITATIFKSSVIIKGYNLSEELALIPIRSQNDAFVPPSFYEGLLSGEFKIYGYGMNQSGSFSGLHSGTVTYKRESHREGHRMLVVKPGSRNQNACPGDSGGPLFKRVNGIEYLVGIVSYINHTSINFEQQSRRNRHRQTDPQLEACKKANQAYYVLLGEHSDFLETHLGISIQPAKSLNLPQSEPENEPAPQMLL